MSSEQREVRREQWAGNRDWTGLWLSVTTAVNTTTDEMTTGLPDYPTTRLLDYQTTKGGYNVEER